MQIFFNQASVVRFERLFDVENHSQVQIQHQFRLEKQDMMHPNALCKSGTEHGEQVALFAWASYQKKVGAGRASELEYLFAVHNQGHGDAIRGAKAKAEGVKKGVSDLLLPVPGPGGAGLWIEMKKRKGGSESPEQKEWGAAMRARGYAYCVCRGWREAARALTMWLEFDEVAWPDGQAYL